MRADPPRVMDERLSETVRRAVGTGGADAVLALARAHRGPIVEPGPTRGSYDVTFVYLDRARTAHSVGLFCPAIPGSFARLPLLAGGMFAATFALPAAARVKYHFCPDPPPGVAPHGVGFEALVELSRSPTARRIDHLNPRVDQVHIRGLRMRMVESLLTLPGAPAGPAETAQPRVPSGSVRTLSIDSLALRRRKDVAIYRPAGHRGGVTCPLVLLLPGNDEWRQSAFLDNLIASGRVPPFTAARFLDPAYTARLRDYTSGAELTAFVRDELLPALAEAEVSTEDVVVAGHSAGAVAAATICLDEPQRFPRLALISGALYLTPGMRFWRDEGSAWLLDRYRAAAALPTHTYLSAGRYEDLWRQDVYTYTTALADILSRGGARVRLDTGPTGHDTVSARAYLAEALAFLLGS